MFYFSFFFPFFFLKKEENTIVPITLKCKYGNQFGFLKKCSNYPAELISSSCLLQIADNLTELKQFANRRSESRLEEMQDSGLLAGPLRTRRRRKRAGKTRHVFCNFGFKTSEPRSLSPPTPPPPHVDIQNPIGS